MRRTISMLRREPIRPPVPIPDDDAGWDSLESAPIIVDPQSALRISANDPEASDEVDADDQMEAHAPKGVPAPSEPNPTEVARHNLTHFPYRSWCPHCLACRRSNAHHRQSRSSSIRRIPLFCADYCFVKDSRDSEMATILAGRLYPSMSVIATVVDSKGLQDERTIARLTQFIRDSGVPQLVYKSDQEPAITGMIEHALRRSGRTGRPEDAETFESGLTQAIGENSAVGESASNGRAERTIQAVEDLLRTLKSALETRLKAKLESGHPVMRWLVEHVASILNRYSVNKDGQTPYFCQHGKRPTDRLVEFGEKVFFYVPRKVRAKLDQRFRLGTYLGVSTNSNESYVGLSNGNVVKSRTIARVVEASRWDPEAVFKVTGIPGDMVPSGQEDINPEVEASEMPHIDGDAELRDQADRDAPMEGKHSRAKKSSDIRQAKITNRDLDLYGYTGSCPRCKDLIDKVANPNRNHSNECRFNIYMQWEKHKDPKYENVRHVFEGGGVASDEPTEVIDNDIEIPAPAPATPIGRPWDSAPSGSGRWNPEPTDAFRAASQDANPDDDWMFMPDAFDEPEPGQDAAMDDAAMADHSDQFHINDPVSSEAMVDALIGAGTNRDAAKLFTMAIVNKDVASTFIEVYGRGAIAAEANGPRRALNIEGLAALDLRTFKPNGETWNFNLRSDRNEARALIDSKQPKWLIGSPPCTAFSIWNRNLNYKHMDKDKVRGLIAEGRKHLAFVISLYRKQLLQGRHFLHEHPASALSWKEPAMAALARDPLIHCVVADQCMYGLDTPSEKDRSKLMPAMKPTRFMTSSPQMAAELGQRCDRSHVHQQLVGGRAANAAFYPLGLIRAILNGIRNTALAEGASEGIHKDQRVAINAMKHCALEQATIDAVMNSDGRPGQIQFEASTVAPASAVKMVKGGMLPVSYTSDHFKPKYLDEYTGEILPDKLIHSAIVEELNYFNERVWEITTKSEMNQCADHIFVRSRWVMCNKGDSAEPDCRARLVACEVNKTGEKNDLFHASTPPLEAKKAMFSRYAQTARSGPKPMRLSFVDVRKAYFNGIPKRNIYMSLPKEMGLPSHFVAKQVRCVYGTRDAGAIWEDVYRDTLEAIGFTSGVASPCCFKHPTKNISVVVHGDDFTALGDDDTLDWYEGEMAKHFEIKIRGRLGEGCKGPNEIRILNRVVRIDEKGLSYEADPRHTDLLAESLNLTKANAVGTPGVKDPEPDYSATKQDECGPSTGLGDATMADEDVTMAFTDKNFVTLLQTVTNKIYAVDRLQSVTLPTATELSTVEGSNCHRDIRKHSCCCFDSVCREPTPVHCQRDACQKMISAVTLKVRQRSPTKLPSNIRSSAAGATEHANKTGTVKVRTVHFNQQPAEIFSVPAYSTHYGMHPSLMKVTEKGIAVVGSTVDPYTSKS